MFKFEDIFSVDCQKTKGSEVEVDIINFNTVHPDDREPVSVINPNLKNGPWIAGGAPLRWYQNRPVADSDIDVFCSSLEQVNSIVERIKSFGRYNTKFDSENAITFGYWSKGNNKNWTIQIIKRRFYKNLQEIINSFDITVCEIGTCGNEWLLNEYTAKDIRERNLRMKMPLAQDAVKRLIKYWTYGYRPVKGLIGAVQNNPTGKWQYSIDEDYNNAF